jgi:HD superfamily phosphodiesterase
MGFAEFLARTLMEKYFMDWPSHVPRRIGDMKKIFKEIWQLALPYLDTRMNILHTEIAMKFAFKLIEKEGGNGDIVIPAIILHDVGWKEIPEDLQLKFFGPKRVSWDSYRKHEVASARIARGILDKVHYHGGRIDEIIEIIDGHDSREEPLSLNDKIVKDADKLWRYSEEGFLTDMKRFEETFSERIDQLRANINQWFFTPSAKEFAREQLAARIKETGTFARS